MTRGGVNVRLLSEFHVSPCFLCNLKHIIGNVVGMCWTGKYGDME